MIVLPQYWREEPWEGVDEPDQPGHWDERIPLLVLPESPAKIEPQLGAEHSQEMRRHYKTKGFHNTRPCSSIG